MALEQIFSCPRTLARLQNGPLGELLEGFCQWLIHSGFSRWTIRTHLAHLSHLNTYLGPATAQALAVVTVKDIEGFIRAYPLRCGNRGPLEQHLQRVRQTVDRFIDYLREKGVFEQSVCSPLYQPLLDDYRTWMQRERRVCEGSLVVRCHSLSGFLQRLGSQATVEGMTQLTGDRVEQLFLAQARGMGQAARRSLQSAVRTFLRFCLARGMIHQPLDEAVPTLRTYHLSSVPRALSEEQAQKMLAAVGRSTAVGLRDYAILLLLYTFGVRSGQVRALRVSVRIISPPNSQAFSGYARADFPHCVPRWDSGRRRNNWGSADRGGRNEERQGVCWWVLRGCHDGGRRPAVVVSERQGVVGDEQIGLAIGIAVEPRSTLDSRAGR